MFVTRLKLQNWRNFREAEVLLRDVCYILGPNASGKSNLLDVFRFLRDIAKSSGGGLQQAVAARGGLSKVRCLHARSVPEVGIELEVSSSIDASHPLWRYQLYMNVEPRGARRLQVKSEVVIRYFDDGREEIILQRPDLADDEDPDRLTQTAMEQIQANAKFRDLVDFFSRTTYLHLVPQLLKFGDKIGGNRLEDDPFGQGFLERIAKTSEKTRRARLSKITKLLEGVIPLFADLVFEKDAVTGRPHLEARYKHHRPKAGRQREDQFSDGTLRLIALFWVLLDSDSLLLLEEPELSLNEAIVRQIPDLINKLMRQHSRRRQILITTHSEALLSNAGIDGRSILTLNPSNEGTTVEEPTAGEKEAMSHGLSPAEVVLPRVSRSAAGQLALPL